MGDLFSEAAETITTLNVLNHVCNLNRDRENRMNRSKKESNLLDNSGIFESNLLDNSGIFESNLFDNSGIFGNAQDKLFENRMNRSKNESNLSDNALPFENAKVFGNAKVYDDATDMSDNMVINNWSNELSDGLNDLSSQDDIQL